MSTNAATTMTQGSRDPLFRPFTLKSLTLANRIAMSPMTRSFAQEGIPDEGTAAYYRRRAEGGAALIMSEGLTINYPGSEFSKYVPDLFGPESLSRWAGVAEAVHAGGGRMIPQLWHAGAARDISVAHDPDLPSSSPSGAGFAGEPCRKMTQRDIDAAIDAYASAALAAKQAGFDGIELHGAHGYLPDAFFWQRSNTRDDRYGGGTLRERARFAAEAVAEVRRRVDADFPIFLRISQWKLSDYAARNATTPAELAQWLEPLAEAGVDLFDCSQRRFWDAEFPGSDLNLAGWAKKLTGKASMTVGSVGLAGSFLEDAQYATDMSKAVAVEGLDRLLFMLDRGDFDLVAVGRAFLANPDWGNKVRDGHDDALRPFDREVLGKLE